MATLEEELVTLEEKHKMILEKATQEHEKKKMDLESDHKQKLIHEAKKYKEKAEEKISSDDHHKKIEQKMINEHNEMIKNFKETMEAQ